MGSERIFVYDSVDSGWRNMALTCENVPASLRVVALPWWAIASKLGARHVGVEVPLDAGRR